MMAADPLAVERVRRVFADALSMHVPSDDTDLIESGLLDSLTLVELVLAVEREFGISLPFDELEIENFRTVQSIAASVSAAVGR
jgi:acyl carrier protein